MRQLGLIFVVFGLNGFLNFLSMGPMPTGLAGQFMGALFVSHYYYVVAGLQVIGGALLLVNRFVPLGLVILGSVLIVSPIRPMSPLGNIFIYDNTFNVVGSLTDPIIK